MYADRLAFYREIENLRESRLIVYVTGDRQHMETQMAGDVLDFFADHLDLMHGPPRVSLLIYSSGGATLAAWSLANMIRQYFDEFEVLVPMKAHSAATLLSLGADRIVMTKQATLGPIDPSVNSPLNPQLPGGKPNQRIPVNVEEVVAYFKLAREQVGGELDANAVYMKLAQDVHPLALGSVYRSRTQIQDLARRLLGSHIRDEKAIDRIVAKLCGDLGSHDYTISRSEARDDLGLNVETPSTDLYRHMKSVHDDVRGELLLNDPFSPSVLVAQNSPNPARYHATRVLVESVVGGSHKFISEGTLTSQQVPTNAGLVDQIRDQRTMEGWKHEPAPV